MFVFMKKIKKVMAAFIALIVSLGFACSDSISFERQGKKKMENTVHLESKSFEQSLLVSSDYDSLQRALIKQKEVFFELISDKSYAKAQEFLHPAGVYYYTLGKIEPADFTLETLNKRKGPLKGIYLNGGYGPAGNIVDTIVNVGEGDNLEPKMVSGTYWLDSMLINFTTNPPEFEDFYQVEAYGTSGNYSSDHANWLSDTITFDGKPIIVMEIESNTCGYCETLMVEFFQNDLGEWKIYALGNKEWTP